MAMQPKFKAHAYCSGCGHTEDCMEFISHLSGKLMVNVVLCELCIDTLKDKLERSKGNKNGKG